MGGHYLQLRLAHVIFVCCSGGLFALRGVLALARNAAANRPALRRLSYVVDTGLLAAALMLVVMLRQYPFVDAWLTVKLLLLLPYIVLGSYALRRARTQRGRAAAFIGALLVFLYIASVAYWHDPAGIFHRLVTSQPR